MQSLLPGGWTDAASISTNFRDTGFRFFDSSSATALGLAYDNERFKQFFCQYSVTEIMRGYEWAQDAELFSLARKYRSVDLRLLLKFQEDGALEFFEELKHCRGSDILECRKAILGPSKDSAKHQRSLSNRSQKSHASQLSTASRDSGYASRPSSEIDPCKITTTTLQHGNSTSTKSKQLRHVPPVTTSPLLPASSSRSIVDPRQGEQFTMSFPPRSPQWAPTKSTVSGPLDTAKQSRAKLFECMYCPQDFVRYGDCLNHEETIHSQRKEWICPHCQMPSKTKAGHDRHHRNHGCISCPTPEKVKTLSSPKIATACYYCGALFEGNDCFAIRADHVRSVHYKGHAQKTRADVDHSRMIESLLSQRGLRDSWTQFIQAKSNPHLSWNTENARELVDALELGGYSNDRDSLVEWVYKLANKVEQPLTGSPINASHHGRSDHRNARTKDALQSGSVTFSPPQSEGGFRHKKKLLASPFPDEDRGVFIAPHHRPSNSRSSHHPSQRIQDDVSFMGSSRHSPDAMDFSYGSTEATRFAPAPETPTPPANTWDLLEVDDALVQMEDIMTQQIFESSRLSAPASGYTHAGWENALPPSIQLAANTSPPPMTGTLPWSSRPITSRS
ncbi:hypothetical protein K504DRAFT_455494 [Pleomassaria siparia CBS 279.74]|uniref:C2H2-type domain-containing protein n=1 Tax=Pleomassaria siparia CBS 279.74 TaxID=1314801 RepID=A0A6G1KAJ0_9PLEO|nr:hypothetical protein K504DRAFT_455494 [Pleomassaria siparia CBS 279.74]